MLKSGHACPGLTVPTELHDNNTSNNDAFQLMLSWVRARQVLSLHSNLF